MVWTRRATLVGLGGALSAVATCNVIPQLPSTDGLAVPLPSAPGTMNDSSRLSPTPIFKHIVVADDPGAVLDALLRAELKAAKAERRPVSIGAARHSQGGHALPRDGHAITFDNGAFHALKDSYRVHAGARWHQVIAALDATGRSPKVMQSNNDFGVAAAFSVNVHGWATAFAPMGSTVRSVRMILADGSAVIASRSENPELFAAAMGGYGLIGLITELEIDSVPNTLLKPLMQVMPAEDFGVAFAQVARASPMAYGRLNVGRDGFFTKALLTSFHEIPGQIPPISDIGVNGALIGKIFRMQTGNEWFKARWWQLMTGPVARLQGAASRNSQVNSSLSFYYGKEKSRTDILHEYFVAPERFSDFLAACRTIIPQSTQELLNITLRWVEEDDTSVLAYAPSGPRIAGVMFFDQEISERSEADMKRMTRALVDAVLDMGGSYYLPYRPHQSLDQLVRSYPRAAEFVQIKRQIDPDLVLRNGLWDNYLAQV